MPLRQQARCAPATMTPMNTSTNFENCLTSICNALHVASSNIFPVDLVPAEQQGRRQVPQRCPMMIGTVTKFLKIWNLGSTTATWDWLHALLSVASNLWKWGIRSFSIRCIGMKLLIKAGLWKPSSHRKLPTWSPWSNDKVSSSWRFTWSENRRGWRRQYQRTSAFRE